MRCHQPKGFLRLRDSLESKRFAGNGYNYRGSALAGIKAPTRYSSGGVVNVTKKGSLHSDSTPSITDLNRYDTT